MKTLSRFAVLVTSTVFLFVSPTTAGAQCPSWDPGFHAAAVFDEVRAVASFDDGTGTKLYAGGRLRRVGAQEVSGLARRNGTTWETIGDVRLGAAAGEVYAIAVFDDGSGPKLFVGGHFDSIGGEPANNIARWDGSTWARLGQGTSGQVLALQVHDDGSGPKLFVGGYFTAANVMVANSIASWRAGQWSVLGPGITNVGGTLAVVRDLEVFDAGGGPLLYATGVFEYAGLGVADGVASWNGSGWAPLGGGLVPRDGRALRVWDDGGGPALYVAGGFTFAGGPFGVGVLAQSVARWNGSQWSTLGNGLRMINGGAGYGNALEVHAFGTGTSLYVGGHFEKAGNAFAENIARFDGKGFAPLDKGLLGTVLCLASLDLGAGARLCAGGAFSTATSTDFVGNLGSWDGTAWSALVEGQGMPYAAVPGVLPMQPTVEAFEIYDAGAGPELYAAGRFQAAGTRSASGIARWDGTGWLPLGAGLTWSNPPTPGWGLVLEAYDAGSGPDLYVGGYFQRAGGFFTPHLARWNGTSWSAVPDGPSGEVRALAVFDDGSGPALYVGGAYSSGISGAVFTHGIGRWNGSTWSSVGGSLGNSNWRVNALAIHDDGSGPALYAAGFFYSAGGTSINHIARWDGTSWTSVGVGFGSHEAYALAVHDGALYASGAFTEVGGVPMDHIARWDGTSWSALASSPFGTPTVNVKGLASVDLGLGTGPQLVAMGSCVGATPISPGLAAWNGTTWSPVGQLTSTGPADGLVRAALLFDDGSSTGPSLFVGGRFGSAGLVLSSNVARLRTCDLPGEAFCAGDGSGAACPCANPGAAGHGCENSGGSGGALLEASGGALIAQDSLELRASGELPSALSIFLQGDLEIAPVAFGDGLRCAGGDLKRLYVANASAGIVARPAPGDPGIAQRSGELGDPLASGSTRVYQVYYRDPSASYCPAPAGNTWNVTNAMRIVWH